MDAVALIEQLTDVQIALLEDWLEGFPKPITITRSEDGGEYKIGMTGFASFYSQLTQPRKAELVAWVNSLPENERKMIYDLQQDARAEDYWPSA